MPHNNSNNNNKLGANHPYSQLRAELRRTRLQRVREAGMQGRFWLASTSTHYEQGAQPRSKVFDFSRGRKTGWSGKPLVAQQRTNAQLNSHMAPTGNRTGVTLVGERRALYAQANRATLSLERKRHAYTMSGCILSIQNQTLLLF